MTTLTPSRSQRIRIGLVEAIAISVVVGAVVWYAAARHWSSVASYFNQLSGHAHWEIEPLRTAYGPSRQSRNYEEWIIRDHFKDKRDGIFLDVGANHYKDESNTYFLETTLGWSGIAVDALPDFGADYVIHRPKTRFVAMFASDAEGGVVEFFVPEKNHLVSSSNREFVQRHGADGKARVVPTTTLNAVLTQANVGKIDFLNMDIELAEPKALAGFDLGRFRPELVCIEGHLEVRQQILDYFAKRGYVLVGKYLRADPYNLYFQPLR